MAKKYLNIRIVGHSDIKVFENKDKTEDKHPHFKSDGVAVWVNTVREQDLKEEVI